MLLSRRCDPDLRWRDLTVGVNRRFIGVLYRRTFSSLKYESDTDPQPILLWRASENCLESGNDGGIELRFDRLRQTETSHATWHRIAIRTIRRHRVVRISNRDDPRKYRNVVDQKTVRIAKAVEP